MPVCQWCGYWILKEKSQCSRCGARITENGQHISSSADVFNSFTAEQKRITYRLVSKAVEETKTGKTVSVSMQEQQNIASVLRTMTDRQRAVLTEMVNEAILNCSMATNSVKSSVSHTSEAPHQQHQGRTTMSHCMNCGQQLVNGAKFCFACGTPVGETARSNQRQQEWAGKISKCPSCGEDIPSFTAICPACGHEINSAKVSSSLKNFIDSIDECDRLIANNPCPDKKSGWSSWGTAKRVFWIIFNVLLFCLPLIIYLYVKLFSIIIPLARYDSTPKLTADEKRKASLIENFPFPNERESILEALLFIKAKISFLASEKIDKKNAYWIRLWSAKASQLYQKAEMMFRGDKAANEAYQEISKQKERVRKIVKFKAIIYTIVLIAIIIIFFARNGTFDNIKVANTPVDIPETELSVLMPQIEGGKGEVATNNSEYFSVTYYSISDSEFEAYKKECKNRGFTIDCENTGSLFEAFNEDGYNIRVTYYSSEMHITVSDNIEMRTITWPNSEVAKLLPTPKSNYGNISTSRDTCLIMYVGNMTIDDYSEYVNECINKGFSEDMSQTDDHYHADNAEGYHVLVEYRGYNTIFIRIDD